jgi:hypothetical protein
MDVPDVGAVVVADALVHDVTVAVGVCPCATDLPVVTARVGERGRGNEAGKEDAPHALHGNPRGANAMSILEYAVANDSVVRNDNRGE